MRTIFVDELCSYISSNNTRLTYGTGSSNLKVGEIMAGVNGVFARTVPTVQPDMYTPIEYQQVDFTAKNVDTETAYADLNTIYSLLHQAYNYQTTNFEIYFSHAGGQIMDLDRDPESSKLLRLSVIFIVRSLIS